MKKDINEFKNIHKNERCFIMGNGPSLGHIDFKKLEAEITFGCNKIFMLPEASIKYYVIIDDKDALEAYEDILKLECDYKFILTQHKLFKGKKRIILVRSGWPNPFNRIKTGKYVNLIKHVYDGLLGRPMFSFNPNHVVYRAGVLYSMLQIAVHMGCNPIYLLGQDWYYFRDIKDDRAQHFCEGYHKKISSKEKMSHMFYAYFGLRKRNKYMKYANKILNKQNIHIINLTEGSKLDAFVKKDIGGVIS